MGNLLRCYGSFALSLLGIVRVRHLPTFLSVEPANFCPLRCPECPVGMAGGRPTTGSKPARLRPEVWREVLQQAARYAHTVQFFFQGEPLLNADLPEMIREAHGRGLYTIVSTNAQSMTEEMADALVASGLRRIIVSMDGLTEATYNAYRVGGNIGKTRTALRLLHEAKVRRHSRHPIVELQCLRLRTNEQEWGMLRRTYRVLGADRLVFKTAQFYDYRQGNPLMPSDLRYARYALSADGTYRPKEPLLRRLWRKSSPCFRLWAGAVITTGGDILPCCFDKAHEHAYGNILDEGLAVAYHSPKADAFRREVLHRPSLPAICGNCTR